MLTRFPPHVRFAALLLVLLPVSLHAGTRLLPLIDAVKDHDVATVRALLAQSDVNGAEEDGTTALHWAVHLDDQPLVDLLIKSGARVHAANRYNMTPLALAAVNGNSRIIERLLAAGADVNGAITGGETPLMTAARSDRADAVKMLIAHGANVNAHESRGGQTALMWAAARGNVSVVRLLLEAGADIGAKTPTVVRKHKNEGVDFSKLIGGQTSWDWRGTDPTAFTALMFAVRAGHRDVVQALLDAGADVNDVVSDGTSALVVAAANAHFDLAAYLLERGADPNANAQGWTVLHQVVRGRRSNMRQFVTPIPTGRMDAIGMVQKLIERGAHVNARVWNNVMMTRDGQRQRFTYMGATPFLIAAKIGDLEMMRLLLSHGADPHVTNVDNQTALMVAAGVALFNPGEDAGSNPEHMAERLETVKFCVEQLKQDVNAVSTENETALHGAVYLGEPAVVEYLVAKGARLDVKNDRGWTPLMIANGVAWAEFYKEFPTVAVTLRRLMAERGLPTENQVGDQVTCKDCYLTRGDEAHRRLARDRERQSDQALVSALKNAK